MAFSALGNENRADAEWREAIRTQPGLIDAHLNLAQAAARRRDAAALAQEGDQIIALQPWSPQGYLWRGMAETMRKQFPNAEHYLNDAIQRDPNNANTYVQLGNLRMVENQPGEALKAYQEGLDHDSNSAAALGGVVGVTVLEKQPDKAIATARQYLAKSPDNADFHTLLGDLLQTQKQDSAGAETEYRKAIELARTDPGGYMGLALAQYGRGDIDGALKTYMNAIEAIPNAVNCYFRAGNITTKEGLGERPAHVSESIMDRSR